MANLEKQFIEFNEKISLTSTKDENLKISRDSLRKEINESLNDKKIRFAMQGSYAMKTIINPILDDDYDLDDGVYFDDYNTLDRSKWPQPSTVHTWIKESVFGKTKENQDKDTCVRIYYGKGYHIDLPAYIKKTIKHI